MEMKTCFFGFLQMSHILFKWANPGLFSFIFGLFRKSNTILMQINVKKMSMQYWGSNPQPLEHESPARTTRPFQTDARRIFNLFYNIKLCHIRFGLRELLSF